MLKHCELVAGLEDSVRLVFCLRLTRLCKASDETLPQNYWLLATAVLLWVSGINWIQFTDSPQVLIGLQAVVASIENQVIGPVANFTAAGHIRSGRLVPVLLPFVSSHIHLHVYYGSRSAQPRRVRAFLDLVLSRMVNCPAFLLTAKELLAASRKSSARAHPGNSLTV